MPGQREHLPPVARTPDDERLVEGPGHDPPVRQDRDALDLRERGRSRDTPASAPQKEKEATGRRRRAQPECPLSVRSHRPSPAPQMMSVLSNAPDTIRPSGRTATHETCAGARLEDAPAATSVEKAAGRRRRAGRLWPLATSTS